MDDLRQRHRRTVEINPGVSIRDRPNGDLDAGNLPRLDAETGNRLVTDVSFKRKVRNSWAW